MNRTMDTVLVISYTQGVPQLKKGWTALIQSQWWPTFFEP
jgi:hypothetical protein